MDTTPLNLGVVSFNIIDYQHPDDKNQAYFPKFVVVLGLCVSSISILMLYADVANRQACQYAIYSGACNLMLPMKDLWLVVSIVAAILVFFVIPFTMFYYEGDKDSSHYSDKAKEREKMRIFFVLRRLDVSVISAIGRNSGHERHIKLSNQA
ncbi:LIMR family protein [Tanacetum coccineum]